MLVNVGKIPDMCYYYQYNKKVYLVEAERGCSIDVVEKHVLRYGECRG